MNCLELEKAQQQYADLAIQRKYKDALALIDELVLQNIDPYRIIIDVISKTLQRLQKYDEASDASGFSSLTILAIARICDDSIKKLLPILKQSPQKKGVVLIGTPTNELHGNGKLIISAFLRTAGWEVIDLGLNIDPKQFINEAIKNNVDFILVSAFLLHSALRCKEIVDYLKSIGPPKRPLIICGGPPFRFHLRLYEKVGCDGTAVDAFDTLRVLDELSGTKRDRADTIVKTSWYGKLSKRIFKMFKEQ